MKIASILENQNIEKRIAITPDIIKKYKSSQDLDRYFCSTCGSSIMCKSAHDETRIWLSLGLLDGVFDLPDEEHMFFSSRPVWDDHCYGGDKWDGFPSNWTGYEKGR